MQDQTYDECRAYVTHLEAEHRRLHDMLQCARKAIANSAKIESQATLHHVVKILEQMRVELRQHFFEEEQGGCLDEAVARLPRLSADADRIEADHPQLLHQLDRLIELASHRKRLANDWPTFDAELDGFYRRLDAHETAEKYLLQQGFGVSHEEA